MVTTYGPSCTNPVQNDLYEGTTCVMAKIMLLLYNHYRHVPLYVIIIIDLAIPWWLVLSTIIVGD